RSLGRRDEQVKPRCFRVELEEIRQILLGHPQVMDAFVTVAGDGSADKQLIAGCVPVGGELNVAEVVEFLSARLPGYMIPARWAVVSELPLTSNGKVDRRELHAAARPLAAWRTPS